MKITFDMTEGPGDRERRRPHPGVDPSVRYADGGDVLVPGIDRRNTWFRTRSVSLGVNIGL